MFRGKDACCRDEDCAGWTVQSSIAAWNRRAPDPRVAALVEAAQAIVDGHDEGVGFTFWIDKARAAIAAFKDEDK